MDKLDYLVALDEADILSQLAAFDPHVAGTLPLGLDLPTSDIDILCFAPDPELFVRAVWKAFEVLPEFHIVQRIGHDRPVVARFAHGGWTIELFGQAIPVPKQYGWRHLLVERRLLALGSAAFRNAVMARRRAGLKTEPAFAAVLGLAGDPYQALLELETCADEDLLARLSIKGLA
ncbi:MAG: phage capsid protein [Novosphingobium sp. 28-62-57]|uniref:DUF4269 domain-containing protein n=1 Tax=unclassified Novosphingobium TaxID=2644732 RepID=UPI000BD3DE9B|nr:MULTISPECIES: DUF4269 domain-containing protein [unclassified Novosphingobium]OYW48019.1 MAG: phage capsid protein [Novosphingobium sp. 12-63-9]OYZ10913.1 MAG: phage capsid protein [Novosphingobium sp. 28-62-57]OZA35751.1 MAG: phage capsid protein [Novosphingobium sp. 17-62-9]